MPRLSIVIPVSNGALIIARAVKSAIGQNCDFALEIIGDGSTDSTAQILARDGSRIKC